MRLRSIVYRIGRSSRRVTVTLTGSLTVVLLLMMALAVAGQHALELKAPGLRLKQDPSVVIPAPYAYPNRTIALPRYRNASGEPAAGWERKYVPTRRFKSDQSAWIYYRRRDLRRCVIVGQGENHGRLCIWPGGSRIVIESYGADMPTGPTRPPLDIAVMAKADHNTSSYGDLFFAAEWSYARFSARGDRSASGTQLGECHQCHAIAFQLTGDNIFTLFP
jgi:hypothetical protein